MAKIVIFVILLSFQIQAQTWDAKLANDIHRIKRTRSFPFGLYVEHLESNRSFAVNADRKWYLASGIKLLIAIEVGRQLDQGMISLGQLVPITMTDLRDGSYPDTLSKKGSTVSVEFLLGQMLIHSDNTASDLLIKLVGLDQINALVKTLSQDGFSELTSLFNVRTLAFSELHEKAKDLSNLDFIDILSKPGTEYRLKKFEQKIGVPKSKWKTQSLRLAFEKFYLRGLNSGTLLAYADVLKGLLNPVILKKSTAEMILSLMARCETGRNRIKGALPKSNDITFHHKTGTQFARVCDLGILKSTKNPASPVIFGICAEKFPTREQAEKLIRDLTMAVIKSGVLNYGVESPLKYSK